MVLLMRMCSQRARLFGRLLIIGAGGRIFRLRRVGILLPALLCQDDFLIGFYRADYSRSLDLSYFTKANGTQIYFKQPEIRRGKGLKSLILDDVSLDCYTSNGMI